MRIALEQNPLDTQGVWADYAEGVRFLIARAGNPQFMRAIDKHEAPLRGRRNVPSLNQVDAHCRAMAEGILLGWQGLETPDGKELAYSEEAAFKVLRHNSDVREFVVEFAANQENYRRVAVETTAKK